jgi:hypothetical protein
MTYDLVKMARERANSGGYYSKQWDMLADRIEKLEAALREINQTSDNFTSMSYAIFTQTIRNIARKALEGKDD